MEASKTDLRGKLQNAEWGAERKGAMSRLKGYC